MVLKAIGNRMGLFGNAPSSFGFPIYSGSGSVVPFGASTEFVGRQNAWGKNIQYLSIGKYQNITMMKEYVETSQEELRYADYLLGRKGKTPKDQGSQKPYDLSRLNIGNRKFGNPTQTSESRFTSTTSAVPSLSSPGNVVSCSSTSIDTHASQKPTNPETLVLDSNPKPYTTPQKKSRIQLPSGLSIARTLIDPFEKPLTVRKVPLSKILGDDSPHSQLVGLRSFIKSRRNSLGLGSQKSQHLKPTEPQPRKNNDSTTLSNADQQSDADKGDYAWRDTGRPSTVSSPERSERSGVIMKNPKMFTRPDISHLDGLVINGTCIVVDFVVGHEDYGEVLFQGVTDVFNADLDEIFEFEKKGVIIYSYVTKLPPCGQGFNKPAMITYKNIWTKDHKDGRLTSSQFTDVLRAACEGFQGQFISYNPVTGVWTFIVPGRHS